MVPPFRHGIPALSDLRRGPDFCRVSSLCSLFGVDDEQADAFAISCCRQQIRSVHGGRSRELRKFESQIRFPRTVR